ncbi:unnamed protein product [Lepeophtheirus salmonis]|uniref:(salmon louse) hypothetical protein n=1 Tax=Lepeophtheirus salmonis TaxID=72036 RepID=A0A7R8HC53_LEPSM|nr:unnamed protein product [Lepeophtheirus salmonis]CAF2995565.1 unnamed protein product [Lepeophtheirus salmonis]
MEKLLPNWKLAELCEVCHGIGVGCKGTGRKEKGRVVNNYSRIPLSIDKELFLMSAGHLRKALLLHCAGARVQKWFKALIMLLEMEEDEWEAAIREMWKSLCNAESVMFGRQYVTGRKLEETRWPIQVFVGREIHTIGSIYLNMSTDGANPLARRFVITEVGQPILGSPDCLSFRFVFGFEPNHPNVCRALQEDMDGEDYL